MYRMTPLDQLSASDRERFASFYEEGEGCWNWTGTAREVGHFTWRGRSLVAHRVAYFLAGHHLPDGWIVRHTCGNKKCVNPDHLTAERSGKRKWLRAA